MKIPSPKIYEDPWRPEDIPWRWTSSFSSFVSFPISRSEITNLHLTQKLSDRRTSWTLASAEPWSIIFIVRKLTWIFDLFGHLRKDRNIFKKRNFPKKFLKIFLKFYLYPCHNVHVIWIWSVAFLQFLKIERWLVESNPRYPSWNIREVRQWKW